MATHPLARLLARPGSGAAALALAALAGSAALSLLGGLPVPAVHDEFSYRLAGDTFASGRLANPTPPRWQHFESFHILLQPSYASKYPPAQGLVLAAGQALVGHPLAGVWASAALLCAALHWMLRAWLPARWAALGGGLALVQLAIAGYWSQSYWGGAVAATGGALLFGGLRRALARPRVRDALALGLGLALLANTRPYEGALASLPAAAALAAHATRAAPDIRRRLALRTLLPLVLLGLGTLAWMALYNRAVTGDPLLPPYLLHARTYGVAPLFLFQPLGEVPEYHHAVMRSFHVNWEVTWYLTQQSAWGWLVAGASKLERILAFHPGVPGALALLGLPAALLRDPWVRFAAATVLLVLAGMLVTTYGAEPHYLAPVTALVLALVTASLRACWEARGAWRRGGRAVVLLALAAALVELGGRVADHGVAPDHWSRRRARLEARLERDPERHLVVVRYGPAHDPHQEWVYNRAELPEAEVLWARSMGRARDRALLERYADRRAWLLEVRDPGAPPRLRAHPLAEAAR